MHKLPRLLTVLLRTYAKTLSTPHTALLLLLAPLLLTVALGTGLPRIRFDTDVIGLYSATNRPSLRPVRPPPPKDIPSNETAEISQAPTAPLPSFSGAYHMPIVGAKEGVDLLTIGVRVMEVVDYVSQQLNYTVGGRVYNFGRTACRDECSNSNVQLRNFFKYQKELKTLEKTLGAKTQLTYPIATVLGNSLQIYKLFHDVTIDGKTNDILSVGAISTLFQVHLNHSILHHLTAIQDALVAFTNTYRTDPEIRVYFFGSDYISTEVKTIYETTVPIVISAVVIAVVVVTILGIQVRRPLLSLVASFVGVLTPVLSCVSTFGIFGYVGVGIDPSTIYSPFLVFLLGCYLNFITGEMWSSCVTNLDLADLKVGIQMAMAGMKLPFTVTVAVVVTFLCGTVSKSETIFRFSVYTCVGTFLCTLYHFTFYMSALVFLEKLSSNRKPRTAGCSDFFSDWMNKSSLALQSWTTCAAHFISHKLWGAFVAVLYVIFTGVLVYGSTLVRLDFQLRNMFFYMSPTHEYFHVLESKILSSHIDLEIFVLNSSDFRIKEERDRFSLFLGHIHNHSSSFGEISTQLWFQDYANYRRVAYVGDSEFYDKLKPYLSLYVNKRFLEDVRWNENSSRIDQFKFLASFRRVDTWRKRAELIKYLSNLATTKYADYNLSFYNFIFGSFVSEIETAPRYGLQVAALSVIVTSVCGAVAYGDLRVGMVSMFFSLWWLTGLWGTMGLGGLGLDPLSLSPTLLSLLLLPLFALSFTQLFLTHPHPHTSRLCREELVALFKLGFTAFTFVITLSFIPIYSIFVLVYSFLLCFLFSLLTYIVLGLQ